MALIKCNECKKKISTDVKACPHCGHAVSEEYKNEEANKKQRAKTVGIILIIIIVSYMIWSPKSAPVIPISSAKPKIETPQKKDLSYYGSENEGKAIHYCKERLEQMPRFGYKWDDGYFDAEMFYSYRWYDKSKLIIKYIGDGIEVENAFGVRKRANYYCIYDVKNEQALAVAMR